VIAVRDLSDCYLYGILDLGYAAAKQLPVLAEAMIQGGVDVIQLRGKQATIEELSALAAELHPITSAASVPLVVNDHPEIAGRVAVEGVHVGQDDRPVSLVRKQVGRSIWVGKSTHSVEQARAAQDDGADYIGFGPIYATPTKPDYMPIGLDQIQRVHGDVALPIFCIGGIKLDNLPQVLAAGAKRVVIVSGLLKATDIPAYARRCKELLSSSTRRQDFNVASSQ
jgi:thiamine-phosphate pyrophosphorylase